MAPTYNITPKVPLSKADALSKEETPPKASSSRSTEKMVEATSEVEQMDDPTVLDGSTTESLKETSEDRDSERERAGKYIMDVEKTSDLRSVKAVMVQTVMALKSMSADRLADTGPMLDLLESTVKKLKFNNDRDNLELLFGEIGPMDDYDEKATASVQKQLHSFWPKDTTHFTPENITRMTTIIHGSKLEILPRHSRLFVIQMNQFFIMNPQYSQEQLQNACKSSLSCCNAYENSTYYPYMEATDSQLVQILETSSMIVKEALKQYPKWKDNLIKSCAKTPLVMRERDILIAAQESSKWDADTVTELQIASEEYARSLMADSVDGAWLNLLKHLDEHLDMTLAVS